LAAYQDARRALADELGIEPSPALRDLERRILRQDPGLDLAPPEPIAAPASPATAASIVARLVPDSSAAPDDALASTRTGRSERVSPAEERKLATALFADLVGATALTAAQDPERTRALLGRFYDAMAKEIEAAGGTVEKFAGDAVMAAFGAPDAQEDHAERALHAALAMPRRLADLFGEALEIRIGVNTGDVVVGRPREGGSFGCQLSLARALTDADASSRRGQVPRPVRRPRRRTRAP